MLQGLRLSSGFQGSIKLHLCKRTKGSKDRVFFTLWSSSDKLDAGKIASLIGEGGGSKQCGGWNMSKEEADKWIASVGCSSGKEGDAEKVGILED